MPRQAHAPVSGYAEARCPPARARPGRVLPEAGRPTVTERGWRDAAPRDTDSAHSRRTGFPRRRRPVTGCQDVPRGPEAARGFGCHGDRLVPRALERTVGPRLRRHRCRRTASRSRNGPATHMPTTASGTLSSLCRVLCTLRSLYLCAIGLTRVFSLTRDTPGSSGSNRKEPYSCTKPESSHMPRANRLSQSSSTGL